MNLLTKRLLSMAAGLLLLLGIYILSTLAHSSYALTEDLLPALRLAAGLLIASALVLLDCVLYVPATSLHQVHLQATGTTPRFLAAGSAAGRRAPDQQATSLVDILDEGLLLLDENQVVTVANFTFSQLLGMPIAQLVGRGANELVAESPLFGQLLGYLNAPSSAPGPVFTLAQGTDTGPYQLLVRALPSGWLLTLRSVAEHQQLDQAKWHFLASVSQELQTSLGAMQLSLNRLHDGTAGTLTPEQHNITYTLGRENKHLRKLVGELLDVSQLELGTIQLNFKAVRLPSLVQFVTDTIGPQLQPKRLVLEVQVPDTLPAVRADLEKTTWVLLSLLANAIRYSHLQDHLRIVASLTPHGQHVRVSVQDQGPGIAPADQDKIFRRFAQLPTQGGSGLGLSIAREFMASQGGELGVESTLGAGSTFWFTLPLAEAA